jgi:hypothetical protein
MMNDSSYDNIDSCINFLFNSIYGKTDKCYAIYPIKRKLISIDFLRKPLNFDYEKVFEGDYKFINRDKFRINYKRTNKDGISCNVSFGFNNLNQNDLTRKELQHMAMLYMGSEIVFNEKFHGIVLPIMLFDIDKEKLLNIFPKIEKDLVEDLDKSDKMYAIVTEHYFKMESLKSYLDKNIENLTEDEIKKILFEIFYILSKLSERFSNFTHGNLDLESILVVKKAEKEKRELKLGTIIFELDSNIELKFTNFDKSTTSDYFNEIIKYNPYFDIHYIITYISDYLNKHKKIMPQLEVFFNEMIHEKFKFTKDIKYFTGLDEENFDMNSTEILTPSTIIKKNKFFKDFIKMDLSVSPQEFKKENINNLSQKGEGILYIENYKKNKKNKKSNVDYNNMSSYKGSRRIVVPGFSNTGLTSEYSEKSNLFTGGSESERNKSSSMVSTSTDSVMKEKQKESSSSSSSASSVTVTEDKKEKDIVESALRESARHSAKSKNKKDKKHKKHELSERSVSSSVLSISEGGGKKSKSNGHNLDDMYKNKLNPKHLALLNKLPEKYLDLAPESMLSQMPNIEQLESGMQNMNPMMGMQQPQLSQADISQLSQMASYPPMQMPQGMPEGLQSQLQGTNFNSQLNVPMMGGPNMSQMMGMQGMPGMPGMQGMQGMPGMPGMQPMMGGSSKPMKKYRFNREKLNNNMTSDFFF